MVRGAGSANCKTRKTAAEHLALSRRFFLLSCGAVPLFGTLQSAFGGSRPLASKQTRLTVEDFGAVADSEAAAAANAVAFKKALDAAADGEKLVSCGARKTYWLPTQLEIGRPGVTLDGEGATLLQASGAQTSNWLLINKCDGFKIKNLRIDGNRAGASRLGRDASLVVIFNVEDVEVSNVVICNSAAKGLAITSSASGAGTRRIRIADASAYNCKYQALMTDRSNGGFESPACEEISFERVRVTDTDHAGIAVNDGSRRVAISDCVLDVNNSTWDALSIRGSRDVTVTRTIGRRGRNGCGISVLDSAAVARGESCSGISLSDNIWEMNTQNGCLIAGVADVVVRGDIARNNGRGGKGSGFNVTQVSHVSRSTHVTLDHVTAIDNQARPTQTAGVLVSASDHVRITSPVIRGNSLKNKVQLVDSIDSAVDGE